ncbi:MAG: hypothetical protein AB1512_04300 [Thermodesulfobacteriota bacterium]
MAGADLGDRRAIVRMPARKGAFVNLGGEPVKPWQILDINHKGLSFRYLEGFLGPVDVSALDILTWDGGFCLEGIPIYIVSDCELPIESPETCKVRRCSAQFGRLTAEQQSRLDDFIERYVK